jgi:hypothetical protein
MKNACSLGLGLALLVALGSTDRAVPAPAQTPSKPAGSASTSPARIDFKVITWFRRDQPLATFKYQIYDVRKGEYTPAVDAWLDLMRTKHPAYEVTVRNVDLAREKGQTEMLKVGSVIKRELAAAAGLEGILVGDGTTEGLNRPRTLTPGLGPSTATRGLVRPGPLGPRIDRSLYANPPSSGFPFPVPYPRPHP